MKWGNNLQTPAARGSLVAAPFHRDKTVAMKGRVFQV
jgi:hypothetical protein